MTWGCSLGEKDLEEENTEEGKAELGEVDADVGLGMNSGYKKAEYKFVPFIFLTGTGHCSCAAHPFSEAESHCQGLILDLLVM